MIKKSILLTIIIIFLCSCRFYNIKQKQNKFNVLFISIDDLRPELGCYGNEKIHSPHINELARTGVLFNNAYCQAPICGASRASLLSGCRPETTGIYYLKPQIQEALPHITTLPQLFKKNGYRTVSLGKIYHHKNEDPSGWNELPWRPKVITDKRKGRGYVTQKAFDILNSYQSSRPSMIGPPFEKADVKDTAYPDGELAEKAILKIRELKNEPFFLGVGFFKPHLPFNAPKKYWDLYPEGSLELADNPDIPKGAPLSSISHWKELRTYYGIPKEGPVSEKQAYQLIHGYYACVSYIDAQVGKILNELKRLGLDEKTYVVLWGDHGFSLGEHSVWCKHCNFDNILRCPLIIRGPGISKNQVNHLVEFIDIYPTLAELCQIKKPDHLEGTSFLPLLKNYIGPWKKAVFSEFGPSKSIRTKRYRYTRWFNKKTSSYEHMLYDHLLDPFENINIAQENTNQKIVSELSSLLRQGWKEAGPKVDHDFQKKSISQKIDQHRKKTITIKTKPFTSILIKQLKHHFSFGTALNWKMFNKKTPSHIKKKYLDIAKENFNSITPTNAFKWYTTNKNSPQSDYFCVDQMLLWCQENKFEFRGHNIFWAKDKHIMPWLKKLDQDQLLKTVNKRLDEVMNRFKSSIIEYDVNNEMLHFDFFRRNLGQNIIGDIFTRAHQINPKAQLYLNEYSIFNGNKLKEYEHMIQALLDDNLPIGGIGIQGHFRDRVDLKKIKNALIRLSKFNLPIRITEFDIAPSKEVLAHIATNPQNKAEILYRYEQNKADDLKAFFQLCFSMPQVVGITQWGFWDGNHWREHAGLYDQDFNQKPAAKAYRDLVFNQWWTHWQGQAGKDGLCKIPVFYGRHAVIVDGTQQEITVTPDGEHLFSFNRNQ